MSQNTTKVELKDGVQVVPLPTGPRNHWGDAEPLSEADTIALYNDYFGQIDAQKGEIIGSFKKDVALPPRGGVVGTITEERMFFIVKK